MKRFVFVAVLVLCTVTLLSLAPAQEISSMPAGTRGGAANFGTQVREVNMGAIPQATASQITPHTQMLRPRDGRTDAQYAEMKRQAAQLAGSGTGGYGMLNNAGPAPTGGSTFLHSTHAFFAQSEVCCTPSDMAIAVGPTYVVQFVNTYIAIYSKTGVLQSGYPKSADTFFGLPAGTYTTDPRGFYDWKNGRYVFVMLTESSFSSNNVGQLMLAVSATNNPISNPTWHIFKWQVGGTGECPDYPTLGHDTNNWGKNGTKGAIYIGINQFGNNCNGGFINNYLFTIPKDQPYAGTGMPYWWESGFNFGGTLVDTLQPSNPVAPGDRPAATYLAHTFNILWNCGAGCGSLGLWSVNNSAAFTTGGPGPTFTGLAVPTAHTYYYPPAANQPGSANSIETIDVRITGSMYYHAGDLWGSFDTGVPAVSGAHAIWFDYHPKLDVNGNITGGDERSEDCFFCGGQGASGSSYFATLAPDTENNVTMTYTYSDNNTYPEMAVTGRRVSYGDNVMNGAGYVIAGGSGLYSQFRWGDYSAVAPDNTSAGSPLMWTAGDYDNFGNWGTAISSQSYTGPKDQ
jgi:hypothetical protein